MFFSRNITITIILLQYFNTALLHSIRTNQYLCDITTYIALFAQYVLK